MAFLRKTFGEYVLVVITLLLGIGASVGLAWMQERAVQNRVRADFSATSRDRVEVVSAAFENAAALSRSLSAFFRASDNVDEEEFAIFSGQMLRDNPYVRAVEWVPYIEGDEERQAFEARMQQHTPDFSITRAMGDGLFEPLPANAAEEYFPVEYVAPIKGNRALLGFDISTNEARKEALHKARESGQVSITGKLEILHDLEPQSAVAIVMPVKLRQTAQQNGKTIQFDKLHGFIVVLLPLQQTIRHSIQPLNPAGVNLLLYDLDGASGRQEPFYVSSSRVKAMSDAEILATLDTPHPLEHNAPITIGDRNWEIRILPSPGFYRLDVDKSVWLMLLGGSLFTALLTFYMIQRIREREKIAHVVVERTQQLQKAKHETDMILRSTHEGIIGIDPNGHITFCNPMTYSLLGYTKRDLINQPQHALLHHSRADGTPYPTEECPILQVLEEGTSATILDEVFWKKDGTPLPVEYTAAPIMNDGDIEGGVIIFRDVTERRQHEQELQRMARFDQLTGLANRSLFFELLRKAILRTARGQHRIAVIYMDLNGFKPVNDTLGHAAGDEILKQFSRRIEAALRDHDTLARVGGDEFTVLADDLAGRKECEVVVERLRDALKEPFLVQGQHFNIGASMGVALYPHDSKDMDTLISMADKSMYHAKQNKHLPYVFYEDLPEAEES